MKAVFDDLLKMLGAEVGIDALAADGNNSCSMSFDDIVVNMECMEESSTLFMYSAVGRVSEESKYVIMEELLDANCFFKGTQGASLGIDKASGIVMLQYQSPLATLEYCAFRKILNNFIAVSELYKRKIDSLSIVKAVDDAEGQKMSLSAAVRA